MATRPVVNKFRNKAKGSYMGRTKPINVTNGQQERRGAGCVVKSGVVVGVSWHLGHSEVPLCKQSVNRQEGVREMVAIDPQLDHLSMSSINCDGGECMSKKQIWVRWGQRRRLSV
jgi:hypothetical protein